MRCIGAENPPCARCLRTGRRCVVQPSRRGQQQSSHSLRKRQSLPPSSPGEAAHYQEAQAAPSPAPASSGGLLSTAHPLPPKASALRSPLARPEAHASPASTARLEQGASPSLPSVYSSSPLDVVGSAASRQPSAE